MPLWRSGLQRLGHLAEELVRDERDQPDAEADRHDVQVVAVGPWKSTPPGCGCRWRAHAEHDDPGAAEHELRHRRHDQGRASAAGQHDEDPAAMTRDPAAAHPGHAHEPDILAERGCGNVLKMPPISVPRPSTRRPRASSSLGVPPAGELAEREEHAHRLDHHDDHDQHIVMMATGSKVGGPNRKGQIGAAQGAVASPAKLTSPRASRSIPMMMPAQDRDVGEEALHVLGDEPRSRRAPSAAGGAAASRRAGFGTGRRAQLARRRRPS